MPNYRNLNRSGGVRSSTTISPKNVQQDIDFQIRRLSPNATPLITLSQYYPSGPKPKNFKFEVTQYDEFNPYDFCSKTVMGATVNSKYGRFALLTMDQVSRPDIDSMYYSPQDKLALQKTGQTVVVVMTPTASIRLDDTNFFSAEVGLTGNSTTRTADGTVLVRNVGAEELFSFTTSDTVYLGRTIYESQNVEATPAQRDFIYDCNFVESKEKVINMTREQRNLIKTNTSVPDWDFQQTEAQKEFKQEIEETYYFGTRFVDLTNPRRPMRNTMGLQEAIKTNVSYYNPDSSDLDWEKLLNNFFYEQAFRYNPNGYDKIAICGGRVLKNFNESLGKYRLLNENVIGPDLGLNVETYQLLGFNLKLLRSEVLQMGTQWENYMFVIDPTEAEFKNYINFESWNYKNANERDYKWVIEWAGGIAWHREQVNALLRTV